MAQTINTNLMSMNAQRMLNGSQASLATSMQRLSSGLRVNSAKDDAAGLAIAERMNSQVRGMNVAVRNANDGISLAQTAEGALGKIGDSLQRMRELAVQSANGTNNGTDRDTLDAEFKALRDEVNRVIGGTKFNGTDLLSGSTTDIEFQVGATSASTDVIAVSAVDISTLMDDFASTGIGSDVGSTASDFGAVLDSLDTAISTVTSKRAAFGAVQNRFDSVISTLQTSAENLSAARGRIMDADFATETSNLSRSQILQQAGTAMVAQANSAPQGVLSLLR